MKNELIYGQKPDMESANYVELTLKDENKLDITIGFMGEPIVWHLIMKNPSKYEAFKAELKAACTDCGDDTCDLNDFIQAQDIHDNYELEFDCPAQDTAILVTMQEIDDYINEVETRLEVQCHNEGCLTGLSGQSKEVINAICHLNNINLKNPLGSFSDDYWRGVLATLRWITMGSNKHDSQVLD